MMMLPWIVEMLLGCWAVNKTKMKMLSIIGYQDGLFQYSCEMYRYYMRSRVNWTTKPRCLTFATSGNTDQSYSAIEEFQIINNYLMMKYQFDHNGEFLYNTQIGIDEIVTLL